MRKVDPDSPDAGAPEDLQRRREIAASMGYTLREDVCTLFDVTPGTEMAWRKRGCPPGPYVVMGNTIMYVTAGLVDGLNANLRERKTIDGRSIL